MKCINCTITHTTLMSYWYGKNVKKGVRVRSTGTEPVDKVEKEIRMEQWGMIREIVKDEFHRDEFPIRHWKNLSTFTYEKINVSI